MAWLTMCYPLPQTSMCTGFTNRGYKKNTATVTYALNHTFPFQHSCYYEIYHTDNKNTSPITDCNLVVVAVLALPASRWLKMSP